MHKWPWHISPWRTGSHSGHHMLNKSKDNRRATITTREKGKGLTSASRTTDINRTKTTEIEYDRSYRERDEKGRTKWKRYGLELGIRMEDKGRRIVQQPLEHWDPPRMVEGVLEAGLVGPCELDEE